MAGAKDPTMNKEGVMEDQSETFETDESEETGTADEHYNLVSVLYHALQGAETCATYIDDADEAGDDELVDFFEDVQSDYRRQAERAKELLTKRIGAMTTTERKAA